VDPRTFDRLARKFGRDLPRRSLIGGSLGVAVLTGVGLRDATLGKKKGRGRVNAEHCLGIGERCDPPKKVREGAKKKRKAHTCDGVENKRGQIVRGCCTRFSVPDGNIRRCACVPVGEPCTPATARNCCSQFCSGGICRVEPCVAIDLACVEDLDCCSGNCRFDVCQPCLPTGTVFCQSNLQCCSRICADDPLSSKTICL
jgi:hypothetical protein